MFNLIYKWTDKIKSKVAEFSDRLGEKGQGIVEYAMIIAAVAVIAFAILYGSAGDKSLQGSIIDAFTNASTKIDSVTTHQ